MCEAEDNLEIAEEKIEALGREIAELREETDVTRRTLEIAQEYADVLAEEGRIPNTPAGKRAYIVGEIEPLRPVRKFHAD